MSFFDRLIGEDGGIVTHTGSLRLCAEEQFDGLVVGDCLREMLANPDSEYSELFKGSERKEFIFHLFSLLALGNGICQPDTNVKGYMEATKNLYKELVIVFRSLETKEPEIGSFVFFTSDQSLFAHESRFNCMYVIVNTMKREVITLSKSFIPFW
mmetsp:Transcript_2748/g.4028  ORF Transcript_2748/g.4028 Transcript_2748/m.4028 type:complete len:155 (-) Transcript_2748:55-519(-)